MPTPAIPLTSAPSSYASSYGRVFVTHAILAAVAWALLAPLSHVLARVKPAASFSVHRAAMLLAAALTLSTYLLGRVYASATPTQHALLTNAVVLAVLLQSAAGALRPRSGRSPWRAAWAAAHRAFGVGVMALSFFVVAHSLDVFRVDGWLYVLVVAMLGAGACAICATLFAALLQWWGAKSECASDDAVNRFLLVDSEEEGDV